MNTSPELDKLAPAMAKAQADMGGAVKDSKNPFFKSKYADLTSVWKACKTALHDNDISVIQSPIDRDGRIGVSTLLLHASGQFISDEFTLGVKKQNDPQADGSTLTYARRYALSAFVGICPVDDDGEFAMLRNEPKKTYHDFVDEIDKMETVEDVNSWLSANWGKAESDLNKTDLEKLKKYAVQVREVFGNA